MSSTDRPPATGFVESDDDEIAPDVLERRICDFDLRIEGHPLEKLIERFRDEVRACGMSQLQPLFYLTDEWGVPDGTIAIGIPFYLADERLLRVQGKRRRMIEGHGEEDILRYLRHEMGHVVNYAYRLYVNEEWTRLFGPMSRPYTEEFRVLPFSTEFVRHLPGGYAQKHPDEDWAETFAVWMTPRLRELDESGAPRWRDLYGDAPGALAKLEYCDRTIAAVGHTPPAVTIAEIDYDSNQITATVQEFYADGELDELKIPRSLDGDLQLIFARRVVLVGPEDSRSAAALIRERADRLTASVYLWTGVDPGQMQPIIAHLAKRARDLGITYPIEDRDEVLIELSGFLTTLAMNYIYKGSFIAS